MASLHPPGVSSTQTFQIISYARICRELKMAQPCRRAVTTCISYQCSLNKCHRSIWISIRSNINLKYLFRAWRVTGERCPIVSDDTRRSCDFSAASSWLRETSVVPRRCTNANRIDVADQLRKQSHQPSNETESVSQVSINQTSFDAMQFTSFSIRVHSQTGGNESANWLQDSKTESWLGLDRFIGQIEFNVTASFASQQQQTQFKQY